MCAKCMHTSIWICLCDCKEAWHTPLKTSSSSWIFCPTKDFFLDVGDFANFPNAVGDVPLTLTFIDNFQDSKKQASCSCVGLWNLYCFLTLIVLSLILCVKLIETEVDVARFKTENYGHNMSPCSRAHPAL